MPRKTKTKRQLSRGKCVRVPPAVLVPEDFNGGNLQRISVRRQRRKCTSEEVKICSSLVHVLKSFGGEMAYATLLKTVRHMKTRVAVKVHLLRVGYGQRYPWEPVAALDTVRAHG